MTPLLQTEQLRTWFPVPGRRPREFVKAVDGVSFTLHEGETIGIVGESGCGKTTLGKTLVRLAAPTSGRVLWGGRDVTHLPESGLRPLRRGFQLIFQDPFLSLNPRLKVRHLIGEGLRNFEPDLSGRDLEQRLVESLKHVGLDGSALDRYPHAFSGGQRQRISLARALAVRPALLVCDEVVSALDVSIRGQIINLLKTLKDRFALAYLFIAHDIELTAMVADTILVMYLGKIVEVLPRGDLSRAVHPYTRSLIASVPRLLKPLSPSSALQGDPPSPRAIPTGCRFHPRCPLAREDCRKAEPDLLPVAPDHLAACPVVLEFARK